MPHPIQADTGIIDLVFAHRFVLRRSDGTRLLADLGPKGLEVFALAEGLAVSIEGEAKPSELKVSSITPEGGARITLPAPKRHERADVDATVAVEAIKSLGLTPVGEPRRKPRHFEVLARRGDHLVDLHVTLDGAIRKEKPVERAAWSPRADGDAALAA